MQTPPWTRGPGDGARRGRRPRLSRERIAKAALELADQEGLAALSMQRVADALGVGTMTLYGYFRSKEELLDAVVDAAAAEPHKRLTRRGSWRQQLKATVNVAYGALTRHPALVQIRFMRPVLRPDALRFGERLIGILREAGFDGTEAAQAFRLLFTYTFGFAGLSPERSAEEARREAAVAAASLPPEKFPNMTEVAAEWTRAMAGPEQFNYGLDRILDGLEAHLQRRLGSSRRARTTDRTPTTQTRRANKPARTRTRHP
jgi:AcrR family transcriptional regulator